MEATAGLIAARERSTVFDPALATRIIMGMVIGNSHKPGLIKKFSNHPEYVPEDLLSEGMVAVLRQWTDFDPSQSAPQTFIYQRAYSAIMDLGRNVRSGRNKLKRLKARAVEEWQDGPEVIDREDEEETLVQFVQRIQAEARRTFGRKQYRNGRKFYKMPQLIAIAALVHRFGKSARATHEMLKERPDLCAALRLRRVPSHDSIMRAVHALQEFRNKPAESDATDPVPASPGPAKSDATSLGLASQN